MTDKLFENPAMAEINSLSGLQQMESIQFLAMERFMIKTGSIHHSTKFHGKF